MKGFIKFHRNGTKQSPTWKFSLDVAVRSCQHRDLIELRLRAHPDLGRCRSCAAPGRIFHTEPKWEFGAEGIPSLPAQQPKSIPVPMWEPMDELFAAKEELQ